MTDERDTRAQRIWLSAPSLLVRVVQWFTLQNTWHLLRLASILHLRERRVRTGLTIVGVSLGVAAWVTAALVSDSVMHGVNVTNERVSGRADLQLSTSASGLVDELIERVCAVPGVYMAAPVVQQTARIVHPGAYGEHLLVLGLDLVGTDELFFRDYQTSDFSELRKHELEFLDSANNLLLSRQVAERLQLSLHDRLVLTTARGAEAFEIWGFIEGDGLARAFGGAVAVMYYPAMQEAFGRRRQIDYIDVAVAPGFAVSEVAERVRKTLGDGFQVEDPAQRSERVSYRLASVRTALTLTSALAAFAGAMLIVNTLAISFLQRRREIGILRTLGATRHQLAVVFAFEGAVLGVAGSALGLVLGVMLAHGLLGLAVRALSKLHGQEPSTDVHVRWQALTACFVSGVLLAAVAAMVSVLRASKRHVTVPPGSERSNSLKRAAALRRADTFAVVALAFAFLGLRQHQPVGAFVACVMLLLAAGALLPRVVQGVHAVVSRVAGRGLGLDMQLATANLPRDLRRTAASAAALMVGAALAIGFSTFGAGLTDKLSAWCAEAVTGDLYVTSGAPLSGMGSLNMPMTAEFGDVLAGVDGVREVQPLRLAEYDYQGVPVRLSSFKAGGAGHGRRVFLEGHAAGFRELRDGKVWVSENFSHRFGVHRGDTLTLSGKSGAAAFEVAAVVVDYSNDIGTIQLDRATYIRHWGDDRVDTFELYLAQGVSAQQVQRSIQRRYGSRYDLFVLTNAEFRAEILDAASGLFSVLRVVELVLLVVVSLGVIRNLLTSVTERAREIGVLRALGMTRRHISRMLILEAALLGCVGLVGGALAGLALGYVIVTYIGFAQTGWHIAFQIPWSRIALVAAIKLPAAAAAGWLPGRYAVRIRTPDVLKHD